MRQLMMILSLVGLFMYTGFALENDASQATSPRASAEPIARLEEAMSATGAAVKRVTITGWVGVPNAGARERLTAALDWAGTAPAGEARDVKLYHQEGAEYAAVRWELADAATSAWWLKYGKVRQALAATGIKGGEPTLTVQLEGVTERSGLVSLTTAALDALQATGRQPWGDPRSASVAARTPLLPTSAFSVNVQVAARADAASKRTRIWLAWPVLQQEY